MSQGTRYEPTIHVGNTVLHENWVNCWHPNRDKGWRRSITECSCTGTADFRSPSSWRGIPIKVVVSLAIRSRSDVAEPNCFKVGQQAQATLDGHRSYSNLQHTMCSLNHDVLSYHIVTSHRHPNFNKRLRKTRHGMVSKSRCWL